MILAQDEMTIQRMLGCNEIPQEVHDEYLARVRFLHRETSGGPMGPGMVVDMLRFLGFEPSVTGSDNPSMVDWRNVERGSRVSIRRAGRWTAKEVVCRFEGFVDMGTLAVELPGGRVDEFNKCDVRLLTREEINADPISEQNTDQSLEFAGKPEPDARAEIAHATVSQENSSTEDSTEELTEDSPELSSPLPSWPPVPNWKKVKSMSPVWVRERIGEGRDAEVDVHDAKFVKVIPGGRVKVKIVVEGKDGPEEVEKVFLQDDVRLPEPQ